MVKASTGAKAPKFYPPEDAPQPLKRKFRRNPTKLRPSIQPGSVLILLAGRFKGKRVVFLKQLESGLLLVSGPFKLNGVPLRRVNQAYVIATSTQVDISSVDVSSVTDAFFKAPKKAKTKKSEEAFFETETEKKELPAEVVELQKKVDEALLSGTDELLQGYLKARFTLRDGDRPHLMKF